MRVTVRPSLKNFKNKTPEIDLKDGTCQVLSDVKRGVALEAGAV